MLIGAPPGVLMLELLVYISIERRGHDANTAAIIEDFISRRHGRDSRRLLRIIDYVELRRGYALFVAMNVLWVVSGVDSCVLMMCPICRTTLSG